MGRNIAPNIKKIIFSLYFCLLVLFRGMECRTDSVAIYLSGTGGRVLRSSWVNIPHMTCIEVNLCHRILKKKNIEF